MKNLCLIALMFAVVSINSAFAATQFSCVTKAEEGYYVKSKMAVELPNTKSIIRVQLFDEGIDQWNDVSTGSLAQIKKDGTAVFKGFKSSEMFGDLSEGAADKGIYLYVSSQMMNGQKGWLTLVARGSEVGLEKATYFCK